MKGYKKIFLLLSILVMLMVSSISTVFAAGTTSSELVSGCILTPGESRW